MCAALATSVINRAVDAVTFPSTSGLTDFLNKHSVPSQSVTSQEDIPCWELAHVHARRAIHARTHARIRRRPCCVPPHPVSASEAECVCVCSTARVCAGCVVISHTLWLAISWPVGVALTPAALLRLRSTDLQSIKVTFHYNKSDARKKRHKSNMKEPKKVLFIAIF